MSGSAMDHLQQPSTTQSFKISKKVTKNTESKKEEVLCKCNLPTKLFMCRQAGPNFERHFRRCAQPRVDQCDFFQWIEPAVSVPIKQEPAETVTANKRSMDAMWTGEVVMIETSETEEFASSSSEESE